MVKPPATASCQNPLNDEKSVVIEWFNDNIKTQQFQDRILHFSRNFHIKTTLFNTFNHMCKNNGQNSFKIAKKSETIALFDDVHANKVRDDMPLLCNE